MTSPEFKAALDALFAPIEEAIEVMWEELDELAAANEEAKEDDD